MKVRRIFRRWQGATTGVFQTPYEFASQTRTATRRVGAHTGRRSNAVNGEKDKQICEAIPGAGH